MSDAALFALAEAHGVLARWRDLAGEIHVTTPDTALALLRAMGAIDEPAEAVERLSALEAARAARAVPPVRVVTAWAPALMPAPSGAARWRLVFEGGAVAEGAADGAVELPALPPGLHALSVGADRCLIVAAPDRAPALADLTGRDRVWGLTGALHALWREGGEARGRYDDLGCAAERLGRLGAAFLGINPVHALGAAYDGFSPYSPSHRGMLDTRAVAAGDAGASDPAALLDHRADRSAQGAALRARFEAAMADPAEIARLDAFRAERGESLAHFALFEALSLVHGSDWRNWPAGCEHPNAPAARAFALAHAREIAYHAWAQMVADDALAAAQARAETAGMRLGLYADLAVGVRPDGAEVWARPGTFARGVSLGAPPDMFSPDGQAWGLAPFSPSGLAAEDYAAFVETVRAGARHAGLIRVDHVLGLVRTYWVPDDGTPGGYVRSDTETLMAILRLEAHRAGSLVVGEDLGVVPEGLRERMDAQGLFGCSVAMYEHWHGRLRAPWHYRHATLASFGTHDTPTLAGWWVDHDIAWRERLGHTGAADAAAIREGRARDRRALLDLLAEAQLLPDETDPDHPPVEASEALIAAVHALMARAGSALVAVQIDDALGTVEQANIPGTIEEHPNWRRRHAVAADRLHADPRLVRVAEAMRAAGRA